MFDSSNNMQPMLTWVPSNHPNSHDTAGEFAEESNFTIIRVSKPKVMRAKIVNTIWNPFNIFGILYSYFLS